MRKCNYYFKKQYSVKLVHEISTSAIYNNGEDMSLVFISPKAPEEILDYQANATRHDPVGNFLLAVVSDTSGVENKRCFD